MTRARSRPGKVSLLVILVVAVAAYAAGATSLWFYTVNQAVTPKRPKSSPLDPGGRTVVALGRIRPAGGLRVVAGPPGDQIYKVLVKEGDTIRAKQPLVQLVSRADRKDEIDLLDQQIADAEAQAVLAKASGQREIDVAQAKLDEQTKLVPYDLKAQETKLEVLKQQRESSERRLRSLKELQRVSPNTVSTQDIDSQELLLGQATAELEAGKALLAKARLAQETGKKIAEAQLAAAKASLERTLREVPIESLKKKRELAQLQYGRTELKAPTAGKIVKVMGHDGDPTAPQQSILEIADLTAMQVVAEVYETDVARLRELGNPKISIRSRALPKELGGTLKNIGTVIARNAIYDVDPTADTDRRVFEVIVAIDEPADAAVAAQFLNLQVQVFFEPRP